LNTLDPITTPSPTFAGGGAGRWSTTWSRWLPGAPRRPYVPSRREVLALMVVALSVGLDNSWRWVSRWGPERC